MREATDTSRALVGPARATDVGSEGAIRYNTSSLERGSAYHLAIVNSRRPWRLLERGELDSEHALRMFARPAHATRPRIMSPRELNHRQVERAVDTIVALHTLRLTVQPHSRSRSIGRPRLLCQRRLTLDEAVLHRLARL